MRARRSRTIPTTSQVSPDHFSVRRRKCHSHRRQGPLRGALYLEPLEQRILLTTNPALVSIERADPVGLNTGADEVDFAVTFSETVTGVDASDFVRVHSQGLSSTSLAVTGSGDTYTVTVSGISGSGTLRLELVDDGSIIDSESNQLVPENMAPLFELDSTLSLVLAGSQAAAVVAAPLDGDASDDLVVANSGSDNSSMFLNFGDGNFQSEQFILSGPSQAVAVGDFDGNDQLDFVFAVPSYDSLVVPSEEVEGGLTQVYVGEFTAPMSVAVATLPGDVHPDLIVANSGTDTVKVFFGNGDFTFGNEATYSTGSGASPWFVAVEDLNADSYPDIVVANLGGDSVGVLLGNNSGTFQTQVTYATGDAPRAVAVGDVNGDDDLDLIVANSADGNVSVLLGNGDGTFQGQSLFMVGASPTHVIAADVNGNDVLDLIVANSGDNTVGVLLGKGDGTFQSQVAFAVDMSVSLASVAVTDFNLDTVPDIAVADGGAPTVSVLLGVGPVYKIDQTSPSVVSIDRATPTTPEVAGVSSVSFEVTFSEPVSGVDATDFALATVGTVAPATVAVVAKNDTNNTVYTITLDAITGSGIVGVDLVDDDSITDVVGNALGGSGTGNGDFSGETFSVLNASVAARWLFYEGSPAFDLTGEPWAPLPNADDNAIARDKFAYIPNASPSTFANVSSYDQGINGIMIDLFAGGTISEITPANVLDYFAFRVGNNNAPGSWATGPSPSTVIFRADEGAGGSDRIELIWDANAPTNTWLEVTVKDGPDTGLAIQDVFYFGSAVADSGFGNLPTVATTTTVDEVAAQNRIGTYDLSVPNQFDFNRDGNVDLDDVALANLNVTDENSGLKFIVLESSDANSWTSLGTEGLPVGLEFMILLSDGTLIGHASSVNNVFYKLTPDAAGNYARGTWTQAGSMNIARDLFASQVLRDGRVFIVGGPHTSPENQDDQPEIYDPATGQWSSYFLGDPGNGLLESYPGNPSGEAVSAILPDGRVMVGGTSHGQPYDMNSWIYDPLTNTWSDPIPKFAVGNFFVQDAIQTSTDLVAPSSVAMDDLDGDGKLDLVVASKGSDTLSVFLGYNNGTFLEENTYSTGNAPTYVLIADFDDDSNLDIAFANSGDDTVTILWGDGSGDFANPTTLGTGMGSIPVAIDVADLNADTHLDLVVASQGSDSVGVLLGQGSRAFATHVDYAVGTAPSSVRVASLNPISDSDLDIVVANSGSDDFSVLLGNGNGTFATASYVEAGQTPSSIAVGDLDQDGVFDVIVANTDDDEIEVFLGDGDGDFASFQAFDAGSAPTYVTLADVNGDTMLDVLVTNPQDIRGLFGFGDGTLAMHRRLEKTVDPTFFAIGNINNDSYLDLIVTGGGNAGEDEYVVHVALGQGQFDNEDNWIKLQDGGFLLYSSKTFEPYHSQRFDPVEQLWHYAGTVPVKLQSNDNSETGPSLLLPDGRVFVVAANGFNTAIYTPPATPGEPGTWVQGPSSPNGARDRGGFVLPNGHVIFSEEPGPLYSGRWFEFDPDAGPVGSIVEVDTPDGFQAGSYFLSLPNGQILNYGPFTLYTPTGLPDPSWRPTINSIANDTGGIYTLTGTHLTGITEGANIGGQHSVSTNFPIVRVRDHEGNVTYLRTFNWSTSAVTVGDEFVFTQFELPGGFSPTGPLLLSVVANGISSAEVPFIVASTGPLSFTGTSAAIDITVKQVGSEYQIIDNNTTDVLASQDVAITTATIVIGSHYDDVIVFDSTVLSAQVPLSAVGGGGQDVVELDDSENSGTTTYVLQPSGAVVGSTTVAIDDVDHVTLRTGNDSSDSVDVEGLLAPTTIVAGNAAQAIDVSAIAFQVDSTFDSGTGESLLDVVGPVNVTGATLTTSMAAGFSPTLGQEFNVILNDGSDAVVGTFAGLSQGSTLTIDGVTFTIDYSGGTGNDVVLTTAGFSSTVTGRRLFYNNSIWDNAGYGFTDATAIAGDKTAYIPTGSNTSTFASMSSYTKGINGIMVELTGTHGAITASDFTVKMSGQLLAADNSPGSWTAAPSFSVIELTDTPTSGTDRYELIWPDGSIVNRYVYVLVEGNDSTGGYNLNTGLATSDYFFFGSMIGDVGSPEFYPNVDATDQVQVGQNQGATGLPPGGVSNWFDFNRDALVDATDTLVARNNQGAMPWLALAAGPFAPEAPAADGSDDGAAVEAASTSSAQPGGDAVASALSIRSAVATPDMPAATEPSPAHPASDGALALRTHSSGPSQYADAPRRQGDTSADSATDLAFDDDLLDSLLDDLLAA